MPLAPEAARRFGSEWVDAWNRHDLDAILSHYSEDVIFSSPFALKLLSAPDGVVRGLPALRKYFEIGLAAYPDLRFRLHHVAVGVESVTLIYQSVKGLLAAETMQLDGNLKVVRAIAHYE
jgi:ketosteroid isomerase-like protein